MTPTPTLTLTLTLTLSLALSRVPREEGRGSVERRLSGQPEAEPTPRASLGSSGCAGEPYTQPSPSPSPYRVEQPPPPG